MNSSAAGLRAPLSKSTKNTFITGGILFCIAGAYAYHNYFIQDDAYISFRYARHFAEGKGLVWYPGSDEFGYTSFLFTLAIGLLMKLGFAPETGALLISIPAYLGSIALTFRLARLTAVSPWAPILASLALATHMTFSAYATGGLETSLQTFLVLGAYYYYVRWLQQLHPRALDRMGLFSALALLTRLDSAMLLAPVYGFLAVSLVRRTKTQKLFSPESVLPLARAAMLPVAAVLSLLAFCAAYYGYAFPNTFYAKIDAGWYLDSGFNYLFGYLKTQAGIPLLLALAGTWAAFRHRLSPYGWLWISPVLAWLIYLLKIGGDFMEFRLLVPVLPFFYLMVGDLLSAWNRASARYAAALLIAMTLLGNAVQGYYYRADLHEIMIESTRGLNYWVAGKPTNWVETGQSLHKLFYTGSVSDVKIAVTAAGAIPYYSDLPAVDMLGLNTRDVLTQGRHFMDRPGHRMIATLPWMRAQGVNLIFEHPHYVCKRNGTYFCPAIPGFFQVHPEPLLLIPAGNQCYALAYYPNPHPAVEAHLRDGSIRRYGELRDNIRGKGRFCP